MPSAKPIYVVGDSHIASTKLAVDAGLLPEFADRIRFWGAAGPAYRGLFLKQGRIVANASAVGALDVVRGPHGLPSLGPEDGSLFIFYGARLRMGELLRELHEYTVKVGPVSSAVLQTLLHRWLQTKRAYSFARSFADAGSDVVIVPTALPTAGVFEAHQEAKWFHLPRDSWVVDRCFKMLESIGRAEGTPIQLQPAETITDQMMTRAEFKVEQPPEGRDVVHKSPEFAAILLRQILADFPTKAKAAKSKSPRKPRTPKHSEPGPAEEVSQT